jgi:hypothetical protein
MWRQLTILGVLAVLLIPAAGCAVEGPRDSSIRMDEHSINWENFGNMNAESPRRPGSEL